MNIYNSLATAGIENPGLEARMIEDYAKKNNLSQDQVDEIVNQRILKTPLDKLLGERGFYKHTFCVSEDVLSPRPDTELLVEKAIDIIKNNLGPSYVINTDTDGISVIKGEGDIDLSSDSANNIMGDDVFPYSILDLGTGSGCILLSILSEIPGLIGTGVDISASAINIAKLNAGNIKIGNRAEFFRLDWFNDSIEGSYDVIVSNPPYIPSNDIPGLDIEVKDHDPLLALDGGKDGLDSYKRLAEITPGLLNDNGYILLEVGINQAQTVADIFESYGLTLVEIAQDLAGIDRCVVLRK